jgi:hypothetical protein
MMLTLLGLVLIIVEAEAQAQGDTLSRVQSILVHVVVGLLLAVAVLLEMLEISKQECVRVVRRLAIFFVVVKVEEVVLKYFV